MGRYWELKKVLPHPKNQEVVNEFLTHLKLANRTEGTITVYRRFLEDFFWRWKNHMIGSHPTKS